MLQACTPDDASRPEIIEQFLVDGVASILRHLLIAGEAGLAPTRLPSLSAFLQQPYLDVWSV
ncbi:MAG: hypothetical protein H0X42_05685 [Solirubrobacterales bacterium]|nr:hypothetical protein [Solirubrobacterales bacterium]